MEEMEEKINLWRLAGVYLILMAGIMILAGRLVNLQFFKGDYYREISEGNRIKEIVLPAPRGVIYDRNGAVLVRNVPVYKMQKNDSEEWVVISHEEALEIEAKGGIEAGNLKTEMTREYVYGEALAHVTGYVGEISREEMKPCGREGPPQADNQFLRSADFRTLNAGQECPAYAIGSIIGRGGIEEEYDEILRGVDGKELAETDFKGNLLRVLARIEPTSGENLTLNIDANLQKTAAEALMSAREDAHYQGGLVVKGTVVVTKPDAEILVLYSSPSFDPNIFTIKCQMSPPTTGQANGKCQNYKLDAKSENFQNQSVEEILADENKPLFNRAISGIYAPGSVFKIITAVAGLETGKINKLTTVEDVGVLKIGKWEFPNWLWLKRGKTDGLVDIVKAIKRSNDIFFYKVGEWTEVEKLNEWAAKFGLGKKSDIDLPAEASGFVGNDEWKRKNIGEGWYLGDTYHLAIGQGYLGVTALQVNNWTRAVANGGKVCKPKIIKSEILNSKQDCRELELKSETLNLIKEGMKQACEEGGTGWPLYKLKIDKRFKELENDWVEMPVSCKTGTAEFGDAKGRTHAWFTVYAAADEPEIVVTVLVEGGGEGSDVAAPVAKRILEEYFKL